MTHLRYLNLTVIGIVCAALAACSFLQPVRDRTRYFLLGSTAANASASQINQQQTASLVLGLGPIKLPDYLDRPEIVTRSGDNQVQFAENDHWAEPLKDNFRRVLSDDLSKLLGVQQIVYFPWYSSTHIDYQIVLDVDRFECDAQGNARLIGRWSIEDPVSGRILERGEPDLSSPCGGGIDQAVAAMSQDTAGLSRQIAGAVARLAAHRSPSG